MTSTIPASPDAVERALLDYATELLVFVDVDGEVVAGAGDGLRLLGHAVDDERGEPIGRHVHPDDLRLVTELTVRARRTAELDETIRLRTRRPDGGWARVEVRVQSVLGHPVLGTGAVLRVRDVGALDAPDAVFVADEQFSSLAASLPTGVLSIAADGTVAEANPAATALLGRVPAALADEGWLDLVHADDRHDVHEALDQAARRDQAAEALVRYAHDEGERWLHLTAVAIGHRASDGWLVALDDVTERHRTNVELRQRATHDVLTGLPNRALLDDRLTRACDRLEGPGRSVTLLFGDLDQFKAVNDRLGHAAGDQVLRTVAARLVAAVRPTDTVARLGGDEFVVVCEDLVADEVDQLSDRLTASVAQPITVGVDGEASGAEVVTVGLSLGATVARHPGATPAGLLAEADQAMYERKAANRRTGGRV